LAAADLDGDLLPEIYIANDFGPDRLLVNESTPGHVRFVLAEGERALGDPKSKVVGRDSFKGMGVDFANFQEGAGDIILVSNIAERWALLESHFAFVPTVARESLSSSLHRGFAPYRERSEALGLSRSGWGWDIKAADFDNDGALEIVQALGFLAGETDRWAELQELATGNDFFLSHVSAWPLFRRSEDRVASAKPRRDKLSGDSHLAFFARNGNVGAFSDLGRALGFPDKTVSRGIALADIDHDGRMDFVLANQWGDSFVYWNQSPLSHGHFIGVRVMRSVGHAAIRAELWPDISSTEEALTPLIGARVRLKEGARFLQSTVVDGGNGHSGRRAAEVHFGVSDQDAVKPLFVSIEWRWDGRICRAELPVDAAPSGDHRGWKTIVVHD
jgi:hypothetical protein